MKPLLLLLLPVALAHGQNRHTIFKDSTGALTTFEAHWGGTIDGRYKSAYDKAANIRTLVSCPPAELAQEKAATAKRIINTKKLGQPLPPFRTTDYSGRIFDSEQLKGKVLVLNFWFVGCGPCEMEMASLNLLYSKCRYDTTVVFLSFVRSRREVVDQFLIKSPFSYPIATLDVALQAQL